ncbi:hypothetical protein ABZ863_20605 [Saccharomonospora sp. NPDC046836]|uniref:hypothetical protein n=1 Tax=Saccharomonospora sp. NPDC046836 TaxID=3156921 RepID=UPI0033CC0DA2
MGTGAQRYIARLGVAGIALTATALLALPGTATAAPVVAGSCDATLEGADGAPLTLDLGAALNAPGVLGVGLGSGSDAALSLPVKDLLDGLGVSRAEPVAATLGEVCATGQNAVNALTAPVQGVLPEPPSPADPAPPSEEPESPGQPAPVAPAPEDPAPVTPGAGGTGVGSTALPVPPAGTNGDVPIQSATTGEDDAAAAVAAIQPVAPRVAPDLSQPDAARAPEVTARESGTAQALPTAGTPDRLPMLLAVAALVLVAAALVRTWIRGRAE